MAESNLALTQNDLRTEGAIEAGFGSTLANWTVAQKESLDRALKMAMRQVFSPPPLSDRQPSHLWSWMRPVRGYVVWPSFSVLDGRTVSHSDTTQITATGTTVFYETMVGKSIAITGLGTFTIGAYVSATELTTATNMGSSGTGKTWSMDASGDYQLPDEFAGFDGFLTHAATLGNAKLDKRNENWIREVRQSSIGSGRPLHYATRSVYGFTGSSKQVWELMVSPTPDSVYTLYGRTMIAADALVAYDATIRYVPGGVVFAELFRRSMLAAIESVVFRKRDLRYVEFMDQLRIAVSHDLEFHYADNLGPNADRSGRLDRLQPHRFSSSDTILYNGVPIP